MIRDSSLIFFKFISKYTLSYIICQEKWIEMKSKITNVVYPGGAGGEFLCWLLSQSRDVASLGINMEAGNKFTINTNEIPNHIHKEYQDDPYYNKKFNDYTFSDDLINMARDHMKTNTEEKLNDYLETRYDQWKTALFVFLVPTTDESAEYVTRNWKRKIVKYDRTDFSLERFKEGMNKKIENIGLRNHIIVDPLDLYVNSPIKTIRYIIEAMKHVHDCRVRISDDTIESLIGLRTS